MGSRSEGKRAAMKYDNEHRTQMPALRQQQSGAQRQKKQRPAELPVQRLQEAVHNKGRGAHLPGHPGLHNRLHKDHARQGLRCARRLGLPRRFLRGFLLSVCLLNTPRRFHQPSRRAARSWKKAVPPLLRLGRGLAFPETNRTLCALCPRA